MAKFVFRFSFGQQIFTFRDFYESLINLVKREMLSSTDHITKVSEKQVSKSRGGLLIGLYDMPHLIFSTTEHITANECIFFLACFLSFELKQQNCSAHVF